MKVQALFDLTGRVAVVTGGNGEIGCGIALGLAEAGASYLWTKRRDQWRSAIESDRCSFDCNERGHNRSRRTGARA